MPFTTKKAASRRVQLFTDMPQDVAASAWINKYQGRYWLTVLESFGFIGILWSMFFRKIWWSWPVAVALAFLLMPLTSDSAVDWAFVILLQTMGLFPILGYIANALILTPWKDRKYTTVQPIGDSFYITGTLAVLLLGLVTSLRVLVMSLSQEYTYGDLHKYEEIVASFSFQKMISLLIANPIEIFGPLLFLQGLVMAYINTFRPNLFCTHLEHGDAAKAAGYGYAAQQTERTVAHPSSDRNDQQAEELPFQARKARYTFKNVDGMSQLKDELLASSKLIVSKKSEHPGEDPRNGILLHGQPGNGKTFLLEALAGELNVPLIEVTIGPMSSEWLGKQPRVLAQTFAYAKRQAPCVLFIDEIDSFIRSRDSNSGNSEDAKITNTILTEIVGLRGSGVVLVGATNYLNKLDAAAIREGRFDFKIEVPSPDREARLGLLRSGLRKYAPEAKLSDSTIIETLAERWNGFSVSRLQAVCKALRDVTPKGHPIEMKHWMAALRRVQGRKGQVPEDAKPLSNLLLPEETSQGLRLIANRIHDLDRIERLGGSLPSGVLFHGPSGTGKTAAAKAIAKESGWAFLPIAGPDLLADQDRLDQLYAEAKDLRPAIVFIDEADEVLQDRRFGQHGWVVNKLLTVMDGSADRVRDVVWIAATNHPEQIDTALLRPGRFTEKVGFAAPCELQMPKYIEQWFAQRKHVHVAMLNGMPEIALRLNGATVAEAEGVLQYALNLAINDMSSKSALVRIGSEHIDRAIQTVIPCK